VKVVILAKWPEGDLGDGVAYYTKNLVKGFSKKNEIDVHLISFGKESKKIKEGNAHITIIKIRFIYFLFPFLAIMRLYQEFKKIKPDIIHVQGSNISPYILFAGLLINKCPSVLIILGIVSKEIKYGYGVKNNIWPFISRMTEKAAISKYQNLVVETKSIKKVVEIQTKSKIYVVPPGIDNNISQEIKLDNFNENPDIFVVSKIEKLKGFDLLIRSLPIVLHSVPNIKVCIAGCGPQSSELRELVKELDLENYVGFLGFISEEDKLRYYKACKLVVVPSRWDCQPITLFEAAASGKPVVASDMSNPEIVIDGRTGLIFRSEDVEDLAEKIILLLKDEKLLNQMSRYAKERAEEYDWSNAATKFINIYREVIQDFHNSEKI
jgi:glycosyltransferase involved in cell wall biosynthesis